MTVTTTACQTAPPLPPPVTINPVTADSENDTQNTAARKESTEKTDKPSATITPTSGPQSDASVTGLTLADFQRMAQENNPTLAAAIAHKDAAYASQWQAGRYPNPVIGYHSMTMGNDGTSGQQGGFIRQQIITGGKLDLDQAIAHKQTSEREFQLDMQRQRILTDVRILYYESAIATQRLELTRDLVRMSDELVTSTRQLLNHREASENTLLQSEITSEETKLLLDSATDRNIESWRRLTSLVGAPTLPFTPLAPPDLDADLPIYTWEEARSLVMDNHPQLEAARQRVERSSIIIEREKRTPIPDIDLMVSIRHVNPTDSDTASVMAGIPIPLFDSNEGNIRRAQSENAAARYEVTQLELAIQDQLAGIYKKYDIARKQTERYQSQILPRAKKSFELVSNAYEQGQTDYLTLIQSQETFIRTQLAHLNSVLQLQHTLAILEGQLLYNSLIRAH